MGLAGVKSGMPRVGVLGPVALVTNDAVTTVRSTRQRTLLAALALRANETVSTDALVDVVWGDDAPASARHALHVHVSSLRRLLATAGPQLTTTTRGYVLGLADGQLDAERFEQHVSDGRAAMAVGDYPVAIEAFDAGLGLWRGTVLADVPWERFAEAEVRRLEESQRVAAEDRLDVATALGRDVVGEAEALVAEEPLRERRWCQLMVALYRAGRQVEALRRAQEVRARFIEEFGVDPGDRLRELERLILDQDPSLLETTLQLGEVPGVVATNTWPRGQPPTLPVRLTRSFGRDAAIDEVAQLVEETRLVTLVGAPGCGKTRLGVEVAERVQHRRAGGVWFVELASVSSPEATADAVAAALGISDDRVRTSEDALTAAIADAELLLVLDNCEHIVDRVAELVRRLLGSCPRVRILATSRTSLGLGGEQVWSVPPLDLRSAVELFNDRAALTSGRRVDAAEPTIGEICSRLAGLPLAIELAAAWARVLSPDQILARLDSAPLLLRKGARDAELRQATMEATVDWSYRLLAPQEQQLFDRLSVFVGGFELDALGAVAPVASDETAWEALTVVGGLVEHSLVTADASGNGPMRYRLLEPLRQCGLAKLEAKGELDDVRLRHAEHYVDLATRCDTELRGHRSATAFDRLRREEANLRSALEWSVSHRDDLGLRLVIALAFYWGLRGRINEGRTWVEAALDADTEQADPALRAAALARSGRLARRQADYRGAHRILEESREVSARLGQPLAEARRLRDLAFVAVMQCDTARAAQLCEASIVTFRRHGDERGLMSALATYALTRYAALERSAGDALIGEALALDCSDESVLRAYCLLYRAYGAYRTGDAVAERIDLMEALDALRKFSGVIEDPDWFFAAASLAALEDRPHSALRLASAATAMSRSGGALLGDPFMEPLGEQLEAIRRALGPDVAERAAAEGAAMAVEELLAEGVAEVDRPSLAPSGGDSPLTAREAEVAELVGAGLGNAAIAAKLFISPRTVDAHLDHIKDKLGLASRRQIGVWIGERSTGLSPTRFT